MKIAVVGSGIAGLVAARELHKEHDVQIFEQAERPGGHTYTVEINESEVDEADGGPLQLDMGFIVYNQRTYPNFVRLLDTLGVATEESCMSFSVRSPEHGIEWNGTDLNGIFAQRRNLLRPSVYRMLAGILRFHKDARSLLREPPQVTLGEVMAREGWRGPFVDWYLLPMLSAIWSTEPGRVTEFPIRTLAAFLDNHGMLTVDDRPTWRVVSGGSSRYLEALTEPFAHTVHTGTPATAVRRRPDGVDVVLGGHRRGEIFRADAVLFACHSDQALRLLCDASDAERDVLGAIPYAASEVVLHTDPSVMPRTRRAWASWNYHLDPAGSGRPGTQVTYWMNRLQNLDARGARRQYFVTLNRTDAIDPQRIVHRRSFAHPQFDAAGIRAQGRWHEISRGRTFFCGAYWGFGFHEDGVKSGLRAARALGAQVEGAVGLDVFGYDGFGGGPPAGVEVGRAPDEVFEVAESETRRRAA